MRHLGLVVLLVMSSLASHAAGRPLGVYAAGALEPALRELTNRFVQTIGPVRFVIHRSIKMIGEIERDPGADLLISANDEVLARGTARGIWAAPHHIALDSLVLVSSTALGKGPHDLRKLAGHCSTLIVSDPVVTVGRLAREALKRIGVRPPFEVLGAQASNTSIRTINGNGQAVCHAVVQSPRGAGIAYKSDVIASGRSAQLVVSEIPGEVAPLADFRLAMISRSSNQAAARRFMELLVSPAGREVLIRHGFEIGQVPTRRVRSR